MQPSPIWKSRKFLILVCDTVISLAAYFVTRYLDPASAKDVLFLIGSLQPIILAVVIGYTVQNVEAMKQAKP